MAKKILITGTHCTGKSTLLQELQLHLPDYLFIGGVTREAKAFGLSINQTGDDRTQYYCACSDVLNILRNQEHDVVYDRSIIDTYVYTYYLWQDLKVSTDTYKCIRELFDQFKQSFDYIFWVRPEFPIVDDGVRDTDQSFQSEIDLLFERNLKRNFENVYLLTGTVDERVKQILKQIEC